MRHSSTSRLRTDLKDDEKRRARSQANLDALASMVRATLDFMRGTESREASRRLDLMALLESIREDALETGDDVRLEGRLTGPYPGRPLALKRCIGNLGKNALRCGGEAEIHVEDLGKAVM